MQTTESRRASYLKYDRSPKRAVVLARYEATAKGKATKRRTNTSLRARETKRHTKYGIAAGEYDRLLVKQDGLCAICDAAPVVSLGVDHDHNTGNIRGLLCKPCNNALGLFRDSVPILRTAIAYLESSWQ